MQPLVDYIAKMLYFVFWYECLGFHGLPWVLYTFRVGCRADCWIAVIPAVYSNHLSGFCRWIHDSNVLAVVYIKRKK